MPPSVSPLSVPTGPVAPSATAAFAASLTEIRPLAIFAKLVAALIVALTARPDFAALVAADFKVSTAIVRVMLDMSPDANVWACS